MLLSFWPAHWARLRRSNATLIAAVVLMVLVLSLLGQLLSLFPEPIGSNADAFREGALTTLYLTLVSGSVGLVLGTAAALARTARLTWLRQAASFYIWGIRGTRFWCKFCLSTLPCLHWCRGSTCQILPPLWLRWG